MSAGDTNGNGKSSAWKIASVAVTIVIFLAGAGLRSMLERIRLVEERQRGADLRPLPTSSR